MAENPQPMTEAAELERRLAQLAEAGPLEAYEDGALLPSAGGLHYEVRQQGTRTLIHVWAEDCNLVRTVRGVSHASARRLVLEVQRFGRSRPGRLELACAGAPRPAGRLARQRFLAYFRQMLAQQFPDEKIETLVAAPDRERSFSGAYVRGLLSRGRRAWAVMAAGFEEEQETIDGILSYGLIWLDWQRNHARRWVVEGLRLFFPPGSSRNTVHRLQALAEPGRVTILEMQPDTGRIRPVDPQDVGNIDTWLTPRREVEMTLAAAEAVVGRIRALQPAAIDAVVPPGSKDVALRFRGLEVARWHRGKLVWGLPEQRREFREADWAELKAWVRELAAHRRADTPDRNHPLYRAQAERWLEAQVLADPTRIDPQLDPGRLYPQVPAFSAGDRGVIDLLGVTEKGRLVVIELKVDEDLHLPMQAVDYWLRVRLHHAQDDFRRYGYFGGRELQPAPPRLYLVAPALRFHPTTATLLRYLSPDVEVRRVGINEDWRSGLQVVLRQ